MRYRRVLLITQLGGDSRDAVALVRRIAPDAALLRVVAHLPSQQLAWFTHEAPGELREAAKASLQDLRDAAAGAAERVEVMLASALRADELAQLAAASEIDLLAVGTLSPAAFPVVAELRKRRSIAALWTAGAPAVDHPVARLLCLAPGARAGTAVAAFLCDHGSPALHATIVLRTPRHPAWLSAARSVTGVTADVEVVPMTEAPLPWEGAAAGRDDPIDLVVLPGLFEHAQCGEMVAPKAGRAEKWQRTCQLWTGMVPGLVPSAVARRYGSPGRSRISHSGAASHAGAF